MSPDEIAAPTDFRQLVAEALQVEPEEHKPPRHCVILRAGFPTRHFIVNCIVPCSEEVFIQLAWEFCSDLVGSHSLQALSPQPFAGLATLVAVPAWVAAAEQSSLCL